VQKEKTKNKVLKGLPPQLDLAKKNKNKNKAGSQHTQHHNTPSRFFSLPKKNPTMVCSKPILFFFFFFLLLPSSSSQLVSFFVAGEKTHDPAGPIHSQPKHKTV
jgi:hypothetical protein